MGIKKRVGLAALLIAGLVVLFTLLMHGKNIAVLDPKGLIAKRERGLMIFASLLSLVVVVPVFTMTFLFAWKYRETNKKAEYLPEWDHNPLLETTWWVVPFLLILILSVVTWNSSHALDPSKALNNSLKPVKIQVVALDWKWLFIYPEQNIASVNYVQFPQNTPVDFQITADAPMNSFWIPQLGGQIYAMSGMSTQLHLLADTTGDFRGSSANISGRGFAGMHFIAHSSTSTGFDNWIQQVKNTPNRLSQEAYDNLALPSENNPVSYYSSVENHLYDGIVQKYSPHVHQESTATQ